MSSRPIGPARIASRTLPRGAGLIDRVTRGSGSLGPRALATVRPAATRASVAAHTPRMSEVWTRTAAAVASAAMTAQPQPGRTRRRAAPAGGPRPADGPVRGVVDSMALSMESCAAPRGRSEALHGPVLHPSQRYPAGPALTTSLRRLIRRLVWMRAPVRRPGTHPRTGPRPPDPGDAWSTVPFRTVGSGRWRGGALPPGVGAGLAESPRP